MATTTLVLPIFSLYFSVCLSVCDSDEGTKLKLFEGLQRERKKIDWGESGARKEVASSRQSGGGGGGARKYSLAKATNQPGSQLGSS